MSLEACDYDEVWGYPCERIEEYLLHRGAKNCEGTFCVDGCRIIIEKQPDQRIGSILFPRTRVCMDGPGAEAFHHQFLLNFLSGGG